MHLKKQTKNENEVNEMNANVPVSMTVGGFMKRERSSWGRKQDCWQTHLLASTPLTLGSRRAMPIITLLGITFELIFPF